MNVEISKATRLRVLEVAANRQGASDCTPVPDMSGFYVCFDTVPDEYARITQIEHAGTTLYLCHKKAVA